MSTLVFRNPAHALFSNWFDRMLGDAAPSEDAGGQAAYQRALPRMDIAEEEGHYSVVVDVPGLTREDVSVKIENGAMRIEGERKEEKRGRYHCAERVSGKFLRSITLPEDVDAAKIEAKVSNGVLELTMPKSKKALPVEVKIA